MRSEAISSGFVLLAATVLLVAGWVSLPWAAETQRVKLVLDSYRFEPKVVVVQVNRPVVLTLMNVATVAPHNFTLLAPEAGVTIQRDVAAGEALDVQFTPTRRGKYPFYCDKSVPLLGSHRAKGMEGALVVK